MSFSQALSGLNAQREKLGAIGNNIANSQTVGFKSSSVQFADVYAQSRIGLGVRTSSVLQDFSQGNVESSSRNLDLAIAGDGFFRFQQTNGEIGYSRNGQLTMTPDGRLVNAQGAQIMGYQASADGNIQASGQVSALTVDSGALPARSTTAVQNVLNLDSRERAGEELNTISVNGQNIDFHFSTNFTAYDSLGNPVNTTVYYEKVGSPGGDNQNVWEAKVVSNNTYDQRNNFFVAFNQNGTLTSIREQTSEYLAAQNNLSTAQQNLSNSGNALNTQLSNIRSRLGSAETYLNGLVENGSVAADNPQITTLRNNIASLRSSLTTAEANVANGNNVGIGFITNLNNLIDAADAVSDPDFDDEEFLGTLGNFNGEDQRDTYNTRIAELGTAQAALEAAFNDLPSQDNQAQLSLAIDSGAASPLTFTYNLAGTTQFGNDSTASDSNQNGYTSGALVGITIQDDGTIMRNYSNEQSLAAGQVALASFRNPEGLNPIGNNLWTASASSGQELVGAPGTGLRGSIQPGATETSNVDLAQELVDMIVSQRAYQANSQTISTQDELLQTIINL
ncbi:flagellar hook-basal body complex protein [Halomonas aquamarina]|uniref:Flagellar hook-basal body complex protein n=1 Tax=Vreelandella aquamarina TaxID=77097 RepID=A0ACC5VXD2_9GAMM|nr:flagellar hook-basal body complex protein [Halomonas aquamarina]MBZ5488535.1 flagellar hook-basal body complex protein [Halomonas aquamarina]